MNQNIFIVGSTYFVLCRDECEERITVISITPQHPPAPVSLNSNSLKKSSLKQSSKYGDSGYNTEYGSLNNRNGRQQQYRDTVSEESNSNLEEYQIEGKTGKS